MRDFESFFQDATGRRPLGYQARIARDGLPDAVTTPAGPGKTGLILAWLWRLRHGPGQAVTPRRLIYALPPGGLAESAAARIRDWLARLELTGQVALHVPLGPRDENLGDWRQNMHRPAIVIGNTDVLVSKALNRGFGIGRALAPVDFSLVTSGAQWIVDDARRCPRATTTLRRFAACAAEAGTAEPFGLTLLSSATDTVANGVARERDGEPASRLGGRPTSGTPPIERDLYQAVARLAAERHRPGATTLVVLDTVAAAQDVYGRLTGDGVRCTLLHQRMRGIERAARLAAAAASSGDLIVVTAHVAEGLDLPAAELVTATAPRADRDQPVAGVAAGARAPLGKEDFAELFDTSAAVDITPYLLDGDDLDAELAWATWTPGPDGAPDPEVAYPPAEYRCRVPIGDVVRFARRRPVWRFDRSADRWTRLGPDPATRPLPLELLLVNAEDGGYDQERGFDRAAFRPVPDCPELPTPGETAGRSAMDGAAPPDVLRPWQSLAEHSDRVRDQAAALLTVLAPRIPPAAARAAIVAAHLHDAGKAHPVWQDALCALAGESEATAVEAGRPWAKSGKNGRLEFAGGAAFRHELASLLLLDGPLAGLLAASPDPDLTRYLVLAHHGLLRVQVRDDTEPPAPPGAPHPLPQPPALTSMPAAGPAPGLTFGLPQGVRTPIPAIFGQPATTLLTDLAKFQPGGAGSWQQTIRDLLARYGPFTLAYLETIVRVADWRASAGQDLPE